MNNRHMVLVAILIVSVVLVSCNRMQKMLKPATTT